MCRCSKSRPTSGTWKSSPQARCCRCFSTARRSRRSSRPGSSRARRPRQALNEPDQPALTWGHSLLAVRPMSSPKLPAVVLRAAVLAGVLVGSADGLRAAVLGHVQLAGLLACVVLTIGFDVLVAAAAGAGLALLIAIAGWGRGRGRGRTSGWLAAGVGWLVGGAGPAGGAAADELPAGSPLGSAGFWLALPQRALRSARSRARPTATIAFSRPASWCWQHSRQRSRLPSSAQPCVGRSPCCLACATSPLGKTPSPFPAQPAFSCSRLFSPLSSKPWCSCWCGKPARLCARTSSQHVRPGLLAFRACFPSCSRGPVHAFRACVGGRLRLRPPFCSALPSPI